MLALVFVGFVAGLNLAWTALAGGALVMVLARRDTHEVLKLVDWHLLVFFAALFVVVEGLNETGLPDQIYRQVRGVFGASAASQAWNLAWFSALGSNVFSNVPFVLVAGKWIDNFAQPELMWKVMALATTLRRQPHHPRLGRQHHRGRVGARPRRGGLLGLRPVRHPGHDPDHRRRHGDPAVVALTRIAGPTFSWSAGRNLLPYCLSRFALMSFYDKLKFDANGLIPAIIQEQKTGRVLMMAWMNRASLEKTIETGKTHFWSRSRQKFWMKGESSGHTQTVKDIAFDCDGDTLLIQVEQIGAACHEGYQSCFFRSVEGDGASVQDHRAAARDAGADLRKEDQLTATDDCVPFGSRSYCA